MMAEKYNPDYHVELGYKLALLGSTNSEIAMVFEVDESAVKNWIKRYPDFAQALREGRDIADAEIAKALYRRAKGYSHKATKIMQHNGEVITQDYIERYPPDTAAATVWLTNRQRKKWKNKVSNEVSGADGEPLTVNVVRRVIVDPKS